jgi:hypothetical protein
MPIPLAHDSRPRHRYTLPDGRVIRVIVDHGDVPDPMITFEITPSDALWSSAQRFGATRRCVLATLTEGL